MSVTYTLPSSSDPHNVALICPRCGHGLAPSTSPEQIAAGLDAQRRVAELEGQLKLVTQKATAAADKLVDYEDELRRLRSAPSGAGAGPASSTSQHHTSPSGGFAPAAAQSTGSSTANNEAPLTRSPSSASQTFIQSRFTSFLGPRRTASQPGRNQERGGTPTTTTTTAHLQAELSREQALRQQAEGQLEQASGELEELSAQLFQEANEMVATERKARAKLEERVEFLEKRDLEKRKRLERLEKAVQRVDRVRTLLGAGTLQNGEAGVGRAG
ncbi:MAG: hypothetical protein M1826_001730 [Phylliscum demangeonii]|nr:MAG: hypothetical protein M1826_001730 [Phylliscum demangeonii]